MSYDGRINNNGITVIDISDLNEVRYCFVDYHGMESKREVDLHTPLDGWTYLRAYYNDNEVIVQDNIGTPQGLEKFKLTEISSLAGMSLIIYYFLLTLYYSIKSPENF